ncbi:MAG: mechanosensitive ion channel family protein [Methanomassiliicoccaceae archaeon]|jgi:small conductance mechanosensitive channel|nr:mechanosensitive ion channel [Euryarchaeota archaeon]HQA20370.1 mechanosensitive ion channel [Methanomassiliicoccaceae archaeon]
MSWLETPIINGITPLAILSFLLLVIVAVIVARVGNTLIRRWLDEPVGKRLSKGVARSFQYVVMITALTVGFGSVLKLDLSAILLSLGIAGIAVAFASQQIIQNAIAGILISIVRPIQLEDWVEVGPLPLNGLGRVKDITLMNTVMRDLDGRIVTVPNAQIMNGKVINHSRGGFTAVTIPLWIANVSDLDRITRIVRDEADKNPNILPRISDEGRTTVRKLFERQYIRSLFGNETNLHALAPEINLAEVQGTRAKLNIRLWILEPYKRDAIVSDFLKRITAKFEDEGIELRDP